MLLTFGSREASMNRLVLPHIGWEIEIRSQDKWKFPISRERTHVVHQIGIDTAAENHRVSTYAVSSNFSLPMTRMTFPANRGSGQRM